MLTSRSNGGSRGDVASPSSTRPGGRRLEAGDHPQHGGLAGARTARASRRTRRRRCRGRRRRRPSPSRTPCAARATRPRPTATPGGTDRTAGRRTPGTCPEYGTRETTDSMLRTGDFRLNPSPNRDPARDIGEMAGLCAVKHSQPAHRKRIACRGNGLGCWLGDQRSPRPRPDPTRRLPAARPRRRRRGQHRRAARDGPALRGLAGVDGAHRHQGGRCRQGRASRRGGARRDAPRLRRDGGAATDARPRTPTYRCSSSPRATRSRTGWPG